MTEYIRPTLYALLVLLLAAILYLLLWPVRVAPAAWTPDPAVPLSGLLTPNERLAAVERLELPDGHGPEDVALDSLGRIYGGLQDGRIIRFQRDGSGAEVFASTGGRPLGLHFDPRGNLIVADADRGLLAVRPDGKLELLANTAGGVPFRFTDDVDIARDGKIYFSDASHKFSQAEYRQDALEHRPNGRLLVYDPATGQTRILLDSLYFANGVAISPDQQFVLVNETWKYRVRRYWLAGAQAGRSDIFIDRLPGFPDGISSNGKDRFWLALASPRNPLVDKLAQHPFLRKMIARLPESIQPDAIPYGFVIGLDLQGRITDNLQSTSGIPYSMITSVQAAGDTLYLGSLKERAIGRYIPGQ